MTAIARILNVDERLEAGFVTLIGGSAILGDAIAAGGLLMLVGLVMLALSETPTWTRGAGA